MQMRKLNQTLLVDKKTDRWAKIAETKPENKHLKASEEDDEV